MASLDLRQSFSYFTSNQTSPRVYLDSAATSLKLQSVADITQQYNQGVSANVHRSAHQEGLALTASFEKARRDIQQFIHAKNVKEIVWTKGATESLNLLASCLSGSNKFLRPGQNIVIACSEHHANIVPWQKIAEQHNLVIKVMPVDEQGVLDLDKSLPLINGNTALVAMAHVSNALGNIHPINNVIKKAKEVGALTVVDGTQAVAHLPVDVQTLNCDFYVFSGHKMFGPTGIGVLYGKLALLEQSPPYQYGGEMVRTVSFEQGATFQAPPLKFEAGTPNIAGVLGIASAANFIKQHMSQIASVEKSLYELLKQTLVAIPDVRCWGDVDNSICLQSFTVKGVDTYDLALMLDKHNVALRAGHHCAMPLMTALKLDGTLRVSLACYNTADDIHFFKQALITSIQTLVKVQNDDGISDAEAQLKITNIGPLAQQIKTARSWDETYRQLMLAGKNLKRLETNFQTEQNQIFGCESQVWLICNWQNDTLHLQADSPSKIVRGLLAIIIEVFEGQTAGYIKQFDLSIYLNELGLDRHLSESRGSGVRAVVDKIMQYCDTYQQ